jgi:hypothetical protein
MFPFPFGFQAGTGLVNKIGNSFSMKYDGASSYFDTGYTPPVSSAFTFSWWARVLDPSNANYYYHITCRDATNDGFLVWSGTGSASSQKNFSARINGTGAQITWAIASFDVWYHIVVAYGSSNIKAYVNGAEVASATASGNLDVAATTTLHLGANGTPSSIGTFPYYGYQDEVAFWNRKLDIADVAAIYNATSTNNTADLSTLSTGAPLAWYRMGD